MTIPLISKIYFGLSAIAFTTAISARVSSHRTNEFVKHSL